MMDQSGSKNSHHVTFDRFDCKLKQIKSTKVSRTQLQTNSRMQQYTQKQKNLEKVTLFNIKSSE